MSNNAGPPLIGLLAILILPATDALSQADIHPLTDVHGGVSRDGALGTTEAGFIVGGAFARTMFDLMKSAPMPDPCGGGVIKQDNGGFQCHRGDDGYTQCSFGYDFDLELLTAGPLVC